MLEDDSREKRELVMTKIREAAFQTEAASSSAEFAEADALLTEALVRMKNGWSGFNTVTQLISSALSSGSMTREDREECWTAWKEVRDLLRLKQDEYYAEIRASRSERWQDWIAQNNELIETLEAEIDRCEDLERNAFTDEFAERMRERIESKTSKIASLEQRNAELEAKVAEIEDRVSY